MQSSPSKHVLIFAGGGLTHVSGGVGTLLRYLMAEWAREPTALPVRVLDTRGAGGAVSGVAFFARAMLVLVAQALRGRVACAHVHMTTRGSAVRKALLCVLARGLGVPVVLHLHGADFFDFHASLPAVWRGALRASVAGVDAAVVIGEAWRVRLVRELGLAAERVHVVLNGVPAAPRAMPDGAVPHILFLGRIGARKGVGELIEALASQEMAARRWTATIAGDGEQAGYEARIASSGLGNRVRMPGWQDGKQAAALLAGASVLVLPSHHEVMPVAVLEAMARGIAIVTTPVGSVPEILQDGVSARLVPPGDVAALAGALAGLLDEPAERVRLGEAAYGVWSRRLDVAVAARGLQALFRAVSRRERTASAASERTA